MSKGTLEESLTPADVAAANALTRRWFDGRSEIPAAASGLGIWPLLAVLASGAVDGTRDELLAAVGLDAERAAAIPAALLDGVRSAEAIRLAVAVWSGSRITLDPEWVAGLPVGAVGSLTGDAAADKATLDAWASHHTRGLIDEMPLDLTEEIDLVLASALSVRTTWRTRFEESYAPFASGPWAGDRRYDFLTASYREDVLRIGPDAAVLTVRGDGDIDVLLALGDERAAPGQVTDRLLTAAADPHWGRSTVGLGLGEPGPGVVITEYYDEHPQTAPEVDARTVGFAVGADIDLSRDAAALGLEHAMDGDRARFDRLAAQPMAVTQANQACKAVFSATGFEAAAVTAFGMAYMGGVPMEPEKPHRHVKATVTFDRPFAYLARHRPTGLVLVAGWVTEPALR